APLRRLPPQLLVTCTLHRHAPTSIGGQGGCISSSVSWWRTGAHDIIHGDVADASLSPRQGHHMQRSGASPSLIVASLAVLAAPLPVFVLSPHVSPSACFENCSTPDYYFARLAPLEALVMFLCVGLTAFAVAVFVLYCQATHQTGRALCVFLFFLL